jgi:superfamily II DNA or RNA helicase
MVSLVDILRLAGKDLYKHQLDLVSDALWLPRPRFLLADDVGLGKTIQALLLVRALMELGRVKSVLVVVPRSVLNQWSDELNKFELRHYLIESPNFPLGYSVYLITLDRAKMVEYMNSLQKIQWDLVIIDEAHKIRLGRERERLTYLCNKANGCILLTATPHTGNEKDYVFLTTLVNNIVIRREKKDVEEYEGRKIFPKLNYWIVQVRATEEESHALYDILKLLERTNNIENIVRVVVEKRAMSSPLSFFTTLKRVIAKGKCDEEVLEEGELDSCLSGVAGWKDLMDLANQYSGAVDRKFEALRKLLTNKLIGKKVLIFTEYATTAEYLFQRLTSELGNCRIIESFEGYARADCGDFGIMYATSRAREKVDVSTVASNLAEFFKTAIFISTDIMSEGVNLQAFNVVVNYEVVWSPTKHVQRVGRIWRFGQKAESVLVIDMVLKTTLERDEYRMYLNLLEKLYEVSLKALPPQSYGEFEIYEIGEGIYKIMEIGSSVFLRENEIYNVLLSNRLDELRRRIEAILREREKIRWKPRQDVDKGLMIKMGYPPSADVEPGGGYYIVDLAYLVKDREINEEMEAYRERLLIRLSTPLSRSREVREALIREVEVNWDSVETDSGEVKEDERSEIEKKVHTELWLDLKNYLEKLQQYLAIGEPGYKIVGIVRARVRGDVQTSVKYLEDFEDTVMREVRFSHLRQRTELVAAEYAKEYLLSMGYRIIEDYRSVPRPFDMVVSKGGRLFTVEVKGRWIPRERWGDRYGEFISFTANEIDWASKFPNNHIVCVVYMSEGGLHEVSCMTFEEFQRRWVLETVRGIEYKYNARIKSPE